MTYRRTQRACRFADRGEKKFTRRIPRLAWREPISPERLRFLCAAVRACQDARRSAVGHLRNGNERARSCQCRETDVLVSPSLDSLRTLRAKGMPRADSTETPSTGIKILEPRNRSKVLRLPSFAFPTFFQIYRFHPLFVSKRT